MANLETATANFEVERIQRRRHTTATHTAAEPAGITNPHVRHRHPGASYTSMSALPQNVATAVWHRNAHSKPRPGTWDTHRLRIGRDILPLRYMNTGQSTELLCRGR